MIYEKNRTVISLQQLLEVCLLKGTVDRKAFMVDYNHGLVNCRLAPVDRELCSLPVEIPRALASCAYDQSNHWMAPIDHGTPNVMSKSFLKAY